MFGFRVWGLSRFGSVRGPVAYGVWAVWLRVWLFGVLMLFGCRVYSESGFLWARAYGYKGLRFAMC